MDQLLGAVITAGGKIGAGAINANSAQKVAEIQRQQAQAIADAQKAQAAADAKRADAATAAANAKTRGLAWIAGAFVAVVAIVGGVVAAVFGRRSKKAKKD